MKAYRLILSVLMILTFSQLKAQVTASFTYRIVNSTGCVTDIAFTNTSTAGFPVFWDFGDGTYSSDQNPTHRYITNGNYLVTLTINSFLTQYIDSAIIIISNLTPQNININTSDNIFCDSSFNCNGTASVSLNSGTPPFQFTWSNGDGTPIITGLCTGVYSLTVTDGSGCNVSIPNIIIEGPVNNNNATINTLNASCGGCVGSLMVNPINGIPPYQYNWNTGDTASQIANLCPGFYSVTVTDSNLCSWIGDSLMVNGTSSCFDTIRGMVFQDLNGNCLLDSSENIIPHTLIDINPGGAVYTDNNGRYSLVTDTGSYTVSASSPYLYMDVSCPTSGEHNVSFNTVGQVSGGNDFAIEVVPTQDLRASIYCGITRPGFLLNISFTISNDGTIPMDGVAAFELDSNLTFHSVTGSTLSPDSIVDNTLYWSFSSLGMFQSLTFTFMAHVPTMPQISIGDPISNSVSVMPLNGDITPTNNTSNCSRIIIGAFDPNDKAVTPYGDEGKITQNDTLMYYRIRFQNTGTDTAFNVVIRDTLDSNLDWSSFKMGTASHDYQVHFEEDDILVFTFNNILLPDSNVNEPGSHGHITYYMEHNGTLAIGAEIKNRAAIYFDFNPPIITNTVVSKIHEPDEEVSIRNLPTFSAQIYPNPTENHTIIDAGNTIIQRVAVTDINGKQLYYKERLNSTKHQLNLNLPSGIYLVQVYAEEGVVTKKIVVR